MNVQSKLKVIYRQKTINQESVLLFRSHIIFPSHCLRKALRKMKLNVSGRQKLELLAVHETNKAIF